MQKWEYQRLEYWPSDAELAQLGEEGWELVAVAVLGPNYQFFFKRPKVDLVAETPGREAQ